jgi:hypothetical protein
LEQFTFGKKSDFTLPEMIEHLLQELERSPKVSLETQASLE